MAEIVYDDNYLASLEALDMPDETAAFDPDAEYNRPAPPIEDGWYFGTFSNAGVYTEEGKMPYRAKQWKNEHKPHFEIGVQMQIIKPEDPLVNEKHVYTANNKPLTTIPDPDRNNASQVSACFRALTGKSIAGLPGLKHVQQLDEVLKGSPTGWGRVQNILEPDKDATEAWREANGKTDKDYPKLVYGQKKIMALPGGTNSQGKFSGAADHPETNTRHAARARLVEFKPAYWEPMTKK